MICKNCKGQVEYLYAKGLCRRCYKNVKMKSYNNKKYLTNSIRKTTLQVEVIKSKLISLKKLKKEIFGEKNE